MKKKNVKFPLALKKSNFPKKIQKRLFTVFLFLIERNKVTKQLTFKNLKLKNNIRRFADKKLRVIFFVFRFIILKHMHLHLVCVRRTSVCGRSCARGFYLAGLGRFNSAHKF